MIGESTKPYLFDAAIMGFNDFAADGINTFVRIFTDEDTFLDRSLIFDIHYETMF